jgi:type IVB pilus formation R64 PilN family outer membrane protein
MINKMNAHRIKEFGIITSLYVLGVSGCTTASTDGQKHLNGEDASDRIERAQGRIASSAPALTGTKRTNRPSNINVKDGLFLGDTGYLASNGNPLPARFETEDGISLSMAGAVNIEEFSQARERITGIRVDYNDISTMPTLQDGAAGGEDGEEEGEDGVVDSTMRDTPSAGGGATRPDAEAFLHPTERAFRVKHNGKLSDLLDSVASRMNSDWVYEAGRIQFLGPQTVTYTLWSLPGSMKSEAIVGGGGSEALFGGSAPATVSSLMDVDYWQTFEAGMQALVPNGGAAFSVNKTSGTIVVTGPQNIQRRVQRFIETENRRISRQVSVKIDVIAFSRNRSDTKATNISGLFDQITSGFNFELLSPSNSIDDGISLSTGVLSGSLEGASGAIRALSKAGQVSFLTSTSVTATNNTPTPINITNELAYLSGSTTTTDDEGAASTELETGIIRSGINTVVTPRIMSSGEVVIQYAMNITELKSLSEFASPTGDTMVQLPEVTSRNFLQTVNIDSGDSIVIASFDQQSTNKDSSGPFNPEFWGAGGSTNYGIDDTKVMIIMTPVVLEAQNKPYRR